MKKKADGKVTKFLMENVKAHPSDIVSVAVKKLNLSRQAIHRHLDRLVMAGRISRLGHTRGARYYLNTQDRCKLSFPRTRSEESEVWSSNFESRLAHVPEHIRDICAYGFTEMFNNAIDHSAGKKITVDFQMAFGKVEFVVSDDGIGVFKKVQDYYKLPSIREAILRLSKGKVTTDPQNHSGEGIFFTSRMFDEFSIFANDMYFHRIEKEQDWLLSESNPNESQIGTRVLLSISLHAHQTKKAVFERYSSKDFEDRPGFDTTQISIHLGTEAEDKFISRSQAKRILAGAEKFRHIELNFRNIRTVGQGFVDEIFRVFQNQQPHIKITYINASPDVEFMIRRGLVNADNP